MLIIRINHLLAAIAALFCFILLASAQDRKEQVAPPVTEVKPVEGGAYVNQYFAFSLKIPEGWTAYGRAASNRMKGRIEDAYAPTNPVTKDKIHSSVERTDNLLTLFKFPVGVGVPFNPVFAIAAEPLVKDVKTGEDALRHVKTSRVYMKFRTEVAEDIHRERIGGADFAVMSERIYVGNLIVMQKFYMTISKGYALGFVLAYVEQTDLKTMMEVINSIEFEHP